MNKVTLTAKEAAEYLGVSYWNLLEMAKQGKVPNIRIGRRVLFRRETLDSWISKMEAESCQVHSEKTEYGNFSTIDRNHVYQ